MFRAHWWAAVAVLARMLGDLELAEDAVQDACAAALVQWPSAGTPADPRAWLVSVARHKALDRLRREARRRAKESEAIRELAALGPAADLAAPGWAAPDRGGTAAGPAATEQDELALIFTCCHPALDPEARVALTLRCICGLSTAQIAAAFLVPEQTMAQRLVRAKRKIRQAGIVLRVPDRDDLPGRLAAVLRVIYVVFTEGHTATVGDRLVTAELCEEAIRLARALHAVLPGEPEVAGLLALLLLTDARRGARLDPAGNLVVLDEQDRRRWDRAMIAEGDALLAGALRSGRPGPYQLQAAIAACHGAAASAAETDWRQIALLYAELTAREPSAVLEANRAVAVAMAGGPQAGLAILDAVSAGGQLSRWPQLHIARAGLLHRLGRDADAVSAYRAALALEPQSAERAFIERRIGQLSRAAARQARDEQAGRRRPGR